MDNLCNVVNDIIKRLEALEKKEINLDDLTTLKTEYVDADVGVWLVQNNENEAPCLSQSIAQTHNHAIFVA